MGESQENQESQENVRPVDEPVDVQNALEDLHLEDTEESSEDTSEGERILELMVAASLLYKHEILDVFELRQIFLQILT